MQRIRVTSRGLEVTQDLDILTISNSDPAGLHVNLSLSGLDDYDRRRNSSARLSYSIDGRDNIADLASWLSTVSSETNAEAEPGVFNSFTVDDFRLVGCVSVLDQRPDDSELADVDQLGRKLEAVIDTLGEELLGEESQRYRAEFDAFAYPLGIPGRFMPVMMVFLKHDTAVLRMDEAWGPKYIPYSAARQMGQWLQQGIQTVKRTSIWS